MVPETHDIEFPSSDDLRKFLSSTEFHDDTAAKLRDQYVVDVVINEPKTETEGGEETIVERLNLNYTRNNAGGLKDAIDFLLLPLISRGLDQTTVKGSIPRPKSDSFEDNMLYFESKLLQRAEPPVSTESPTRTNFGGDDNVSRSIFDKLRKPGSMSSFTSFMERRRKNGSQSPSLFMHASNNASRASLASLESRDSGYRNPWNDSGIDLDHDQQNGHTHANSWGSFAPTSRPATSNSLSGAFPFGANSNASTSSLNTPMIPGLGMVNGSATTVGASSTNGDVTPKYDALKDGGDYGKGNVASAEGSKHPQPISRPGSTSAATSTHTSASTTSGYPAPIGPPH